MPSLQDLAVLFEMFFLRLVLPLLIVLGIGSLLWSRFAPREAIQRRVSFSRFVVGVRKLELPRINLLELSANTILTLLIVFLIWVAAAGFLIARFFFGLGSVTALSDIVPWGLWIGFDVMTGVALAAGGFTLAATVYVFRLERYRPILRPAILTALLGYILVVLALLVDLGRWYNIWHVIIMWNPHSVMFEVGWCVILYLTVLMLEFSPAVWERFHIVWAQRLLHKIVIPLVIIGCILSTLHQSSLGSLYLIFETKMSPLWYSPLLPVFFFTSALATGLAMVMVESTLSARAFGRKIEHDLLASLGKPAAIILGIYLVLKVADLLMRGVLPRLMNLDFISLLLWVELIFGVIAPMAIFATRNGRENPTWRFRAALLVVLGIMLNRMNIAVFGFWEYTGTLGTYYFPSFAEWIITLAIATAGVAAYVAAAKFLPVLPEPSRAHVVAE